MLTQMHGTYNPYLVALSILVASFASYTALDLSGRVPPAQGRTHRIWLAAAALIMGGGIWSMHFVAMLAFVLPMPMSYDVGLTVLSLVLAISAASGSFYVISRPGVSRPGLVLSGVFMGIAIFGMHYTGMAAMRGPVELSYDPLWFALSVIIAIGAATAVAGVPNHGPWAEARCRHRPGHRYFRHALHRDAGRGLHRSRHDGGCARGP